MDFLGVDEVENILYFKILILRNSQYYIQAYATNSLAEHLEKKYIYLNYFVNLFYLFLLAIDTVMETTQFGITGRRIYPVLSILV